MAESSSSSGCCNAPFCIGASCGNFPLWTFSGMTESNSDNCTLYIRFEYFATTQQVEVYSDPLYANLVAIGQDSLSPIALVQRNSSGLSGTVTWDGTPVDNPTTAILTCDELSTSSSTSSTSSVDSESSFSTSSSSTSSSHSSSSSSICCTNPLCFGSSCSRFSSWTFAGMDDGNSTNCRLFVALEYLVTDEQEIRVFKDADRNLLVALGQGDDTAPIVIEQRNNSGLTGTVVWDGTPVYNPQVLTLDCEGSSSSSTSYSSSSSESSI